MSVLGEAIGAIKDALKLACAVKRTGETPKDIARELREHDRRITRIEAKWEAAVELSAGRGAVAQRLEVASARRSNVIGSKQRRPWQAGELQNRCLAAEWRRFLTAVHSSCAIA